ncbi:MAG: cation:proton antiporter, partial [Actinomycetota bacterium]
MDRASADTITLIALVAVVAPLLAALARGRVPGVVLEIALGIVVGPQVLGLATVTPIVEALGSIGLSFLFFMAGFEMDLARIRGLPLRRAGIGWAVSLLLGLAIATAAVADGLAVSVVLIGLALTTTAIGTLVPILADADELSTPFGAHLLAIGAVGEFLPLTAVTLLATEGSTAGTALVLALFVLLAIGAAAAALRPRPPRLGRLLAAGLHTSSQLPVRVIVLLVIGLVFVASHLGLDALLGAFAAGLVVRLA